MQLREKRKYSIISQSQLRPGQSSIRQPLLLLSPNLLYAVYLLAVYMLCTYFHFSAAPAAFAI